MQDYFYIRMKNRFIQLRFGEIIYLKARGDCVQIVCEQRTITMSNTLTWIKQFLPDEMFCRIHHSYVVALNRVKDFDRTWVELHAPPKGKEYKQGLARVRKLPVGWLGYRNQFRASVLLVKNKRGCYLATKRRAMYELEGDEIKYELMKTID